MDVVPFNCLGYLNLFSFYNFEGFHCLSDQTIIIMNHMFALGPQIAKSATD